MDVIAKARHIRMSPRKVRLVADLVRGMDVDTAEAQLRFFRKAAARPVLKVILSAKANAEHNFKIAPETLFIKAIAVDGGPVLHRWRARAFGRAAAIRKRSAHITVTLAERPLGAAGVSAAVVKPSAAKAEGKPAKAEKKAARPAKAPKAAKKSPKSKA
jgi:large subunit ribosomal protein L22